ncbi:MAG TPA: hypothetical protein VER08_11725 [Pyrinomonadaceae bacterium]|nr:hypothetical protein [Pyrinomonadaceae bacterium]
MFGLGSITKAFGLDKLFDSIGMPWMNNLLSLGVNIMSGNWLAAAKDVFDLVSQFSNSWTSRVASQQPLGPFGSDSRFGTESFNPARASELNGLARDEDPMGLRTSSRAIFVAYETAFNHSVANRNLRNANAQFAV